MESSGISASDVLALTKNNDDGFLANGNGLIILILFFLIFGGGFGNNNNGLTQAELQAGLYNQTTDRNLSDITSAIYNTNTNMLSSVAGINNNIMQNRYDNAIQTQTLTANTNTGFNNIASQIASCCCENKMLGMQNTSDIVNAIKSEGESTRDMIQQNYINGLMNEISDLKTSLSNEKQSQDLLNIMGRWRSYPACPYGSCTYNTGTTI